MDNESTKLITQYDAVRRVVTGKIGEITMRTCTVGRIIVGLSLMEAAQAGKETGRSAWVSAAAAAP